MDRRAHLHTCAAALRRRLRREDGVVLVMVAILMVALMASAAYAIDIGSARQAQEKAQVAADAGALAAADDEGVDASKEAADATTVAQLNDPGASVSFSGANERAQVSVSNSSNNSVGKAIGSGAIPVSASATADSVGSENQAAIYAQDGCSSSSPAVDIESNADDTSTSPTLPSFIDGAIDTNGNLTIANNSDIWFENSSPVSETINSGTTTIPAFVDAITYGQGCSDTIKSNSTTSAHFSSSTQVTQRSAAVSNWPVNYLSEPYNVNTGCATTQTGTWPYCSGSGNACTDWWSGDTTFTATPNNTAFSDSGVYCIDGQATFNNYQLFSGSVTIIAKGIAVNNVKKIQAAPNYNNDLFFYCTAPAGTYTCSMQTNQFTGGTIFAPYNTLQISSNTDLQLNGYLEAKDVKITANNAIQITGNGPLVSGSSALSN